MLYPLIVRDFLDRAEHVYPDRVAVVDEPDQPAPSLGEITYREMAALARAQAARLDQLGVPPGGRVAIVSQNSARLLTSFFGVSGWGRVLVPINFRLAQAEIDYIVRHSGASAVFVDPALRDVLPGIDVPHRFVLGDDDALYARGAEPREWAEPDENATATINYTSGTTARPKGVQLTHRNCWVNARSSAGTPGSPTATSTCTPCPCSTPTGGACPGHHRGGRPQVALRKVDGTEILRRVERHGVSLLCAAPAVVNAVLDAAAVGRTGAGRRQDPHRGGRRPTAEPDHRAGRDRARLGVQPDLRADRDVAAADHQPAPRRVGRPLGPADRARKLMRAGAPAVGTAVGGRPRRGGAGPEQHRHGRVLEPARGDRRPRWRAGGSTPGTAGSSTTRGT